MNRPIKTLPTHDCRSRWPRVHWARRLVSCSLLISCVLLLAACSTTRVHQGQALSGNAGWGIAALSNHSETPLAGQRVEGMLLTALGQQGVSSPQVAPRQTPVNPLAFSNDNDLQGALSWAQGRSLRYLVTGAVEEWHYKTGLDGEPAVGLTLQVRDANSGEVLWSASGARSGWGFSTLSGVGGELLDDLVSELPIGP